MRPSPSTLSFAETLVARGLRDSSTLSLDATITPAALGALAPIEPPRVPLPRISLSLPGHLGGETSEALPRSDRELEIVSLLGEGGMGSVYLAKQRSLEREVAVKTTKQVGSVDATSALCAEAIVTGHLEHPGIVPVHQLALAPDGRPVLVMKRVEGTSWRVLLADASDPAWAPLRVDPAERPTFHLEVLRRVCEALAFAHSRGIVHRDLKPENVMIGAFGEVYLVDWGIASDAGTRGGETLVGTPVYMAPEMVAGGMVDARTDVFLVGATLHEILTGAPPHRGTTIHGVLLAAYEAVAPTYPDDVDPELAAIATRAMARDPADRFGDAREIVDALRAHARHRASRALSRRADERRAELAARVDATIADADIPSLYALLAECRFAYSEAAREWSENDAVPRGEQACHAHAVSIEIARRDPVAARAQLSALDAPDAALSARVERLERELDAQRAEDARMRRLADASDARASPGVRILAGFVSAIGTVMISIWAYSRFRNGDVDNQDALVFSLITFVTMLAALATFGRGLWRHPFNQRLAVWALITVGSIVVDRVAALIAGTPVPTMLMHDMVIVGVAFAAASVFTFRVLALGALFGFGGALHAAAFPDLVPITFGVSGVLAILTIPMAAWHARRSTP